MKARKHLRRTAAVTAAVVAGGIAVGGTASADSTPTISVNPTHGSFSTTFDITPPNPDCSAGATAWEVYLAPLGTNIASPPPGTVIQLSSDATFDTLTGPPGANGAIPAITEVDFSNSGLAGFIPAAGQYMLGVACLNATTATDNWWTTVSFDGAATSTNSPSWSVSSSATTAVGTSTVLTASPSSPAAHGSAETLSAAVTAASGSAVPAGSVDFKDGTTDLGTATVNSSGVATLTQTLADGAHSLTATFTPADATAFSASTSAAVGYTVNPAQSQLGSGSESVTVTIPQSTGAGSFTLTVPSTPAGLTVSADGTSATGSLAPVSVSDTRASSTGWTVSGQASDFTSAGGDSIPGDALGWTPSASDTTGAAVTAGHAVAPDSPGLGGTAATLGSSTGDSTATLGAGLDLAIPSGQASGTYTSTITITAI